MDTIVEVSSSLSASVTTLFQILSTTYGVLPAIVLSIALTVGLFVSIKWLCTKVYRSFKKREVSLQPQTY